MQIAVFLSIILISAAFIAVKFKSRYKGFLCLRSAGVPKEKIVKIEKRLSHCAGIVSCKLRREIDIFNSMNLVMLCRGKVPIVYSQFLGRLVLEPRWIITNNDSVQRLLYICAAVNLYAHSGDGLVKRQLIKNCIYVFGQRDIIKSVRNLKRTKRIYFSHRKLRYKYLCGKFIFAQNRIDRPSYTIYTERSDTNNCESTFNTKTCDLKKHYADKHLPIQCIETAAEQFSYYVGDDKFKYNLTHTSDTFFAVGNNEAIGIYVQDSVVFGSSICEKSNDLKIYANTKCGKYYVVRGKTKNEIIAAVTELKRRRGQLEYLLTLQEAIEVAFIEETFERAWKSRFVYGEKLKQKFLSACKYIPTLFLPTLVYKIEQPADFFTVIDSFNMFRRIAKAVNSMNIVFLYSSANDEVREIIKAFADKETAHDLIANGVFLFFIDGISIESDAMNYLCLMSDPASYVKNKPKENNKAVEVTAHISNSFPVTHTIYVRNTLKQPQTGYVNIPLAVGNELKNLPFGMAAICKRQAGVLQVTSLKSGRSINYKLPNGASVKDELGREIGDAEIACDNVYVGCDVKLAGYEEKTLKIVKGEGTLSRTARKEAFIGSLDNVKVKSNTDLQRLFEIKITDGSDEKLCSSLKDAVKNFERDIFFALLHNREKITPDIYSFLIERVIGIKLLRGKIQLMPCITITGSFELSFNYKGAPYNFKVIERNNGFSINYGDNEYKNFLQISIS